LIIKAKRKKRNYIGLNNHILLKKYLN